MEWISRAKAILGMACSEENFFGFPCALRALCGEIPEQTQKAPLISKNFFAFPLRPLR